MSAEDRRLLRWIADAGRAGRTAYERPTWSESPDMDGRQRLVAAGLVWESRRRETPGGDGIARHVVAGLGLIALASGGQA